MSAHGNVQRGDYYERKFAARIGGYKISMRRRSGPDVVKRRNKLIMEYRTFEVKRVKKGLKMLTDFLDQAYDEGADAVAIRVGNRKSWIIVKDLQDE